MGTHILQKQNIIPHTNFDELFQIKIPALKGRARTTNLLILETIATYGPLLKYDVYKRLNNRGITEYSTVTRRIDSLRERGYLGEANQRMTERGKRRAESMFGLTWKGFIASFVSKAVREDALQVIEKNPLLFIPEKEFVLLVVREVFDSKEIEKITALLLQGCLEAIPNLEIIEEYQLALYVLQGMREIPPDLMRISEIPEKKKDLTKLLDNPRILKLVKEKILPILSEWQKNLYVMFQIFKVMNQVGDFIKKLQPDDKPSERLKEYLKTLKVDEKTIMLETNN